MGKSGDKVLVDPSLLGRVVARLERVGLCLELTNQQFDIIFQFCSGYTKLETVLLKYLTAFMFGNDDVTNNKNKPRNVGASLRCFHYKIDLQ